MPLERTSAPSHLPDVLDRVLDRGIRLEAQARAAPASRPLRAAGVRLEVGPRAPTPEPPAGRA